MMEVRATLSDNQGFSLIETLVAVFMLSVVSMITLGIMMNFVDANQMLSSKMSSMEKIENTRDYLRADLKEALERGFLAQENNSEQNRLLFRLTRGNGELSRVDEEVSPIETIEYWVDDDLLIRRIYDRPEVTANTPFREYILIDNIAEIDFRFFNGNIWQNYWMSEENLSRTPLPKAIEISWLNHGQQNHKDNRIKSRFPMGVAL